MPIGSGKHWQNTRYMPFSNDGAGRIPPWAAMEFTGTIVTNGVLLIQVQKPTEDASRCVVFNGATVVDNGETGTCTNDFPAQALGASALGNGDLAAVIAGSWELDTPSITAIGKIEEEPCAYYFTVVGAGGAPNTVLVVLNECPRHPEQAWCEFLTDILCSDSGSGLYLTKCSATWFFNKSGTDCEFTCSDTTCVDVACL